MDTGFVKETMNDYICDKSRGGLELFLCNHKILKNPNFMMLIENYVLEMNDIPKLVIIPVRNFEDSAKSRYKNSEIHGLLPESLREDITFYTEGDGGLWNAIDIDSQVIFYNKCFANYIQIMTKYKIPTLFIDFIHMTTDPKYLFDLVKELFPYDITFEKFLECWHQASDLCAR